MFPTIGLLTERRANKNDILNTLKISLDEDLDMPVFYLNSHTSFHEMLFYVTDKEKAFSLAALTSVIATFSCK